MRNSNFWMLFAAAFLLLTCISCIPDSSTRSASFGSVKAGLYNRKLKNMILAVKALTIGGKTDSYDLEDYPGNDPSPSSKVDVYSAPIENGSPLMHFLQPTPPPVPGKVSS